MSNSTQQSQPPQAAVDQIIGLYNQGQLEQTVSLSESLATQYPNALILYDILGAAYMGLKNIDKTIESYQKAQLLKPNHTDAYNNIGMVFYDQGRFEEAVESYQKAVKLEPDFADAHYNLGNALKQSGDTRQALESYKASISVNPNDAEVLLIYGNTLKDYGEFDQAIAAYAQVLKIEPTSAAAQTNLDNAVMEKHEIEFLIQKSLKQDDVIPEAAQKLQNMAVWLYDKGNSQKALENLENAIEICPQYAEAYLIMGIILPENGDLEAAVDSYKQAIKIKSDYAEAYNNMGVALTEKGDLDAAINICKQALEVKPNYAEAWSNVFFPLQAIKWQTSSLENWLALLPDQTSNHAQIAKSILEYQLNLGSVSAENSLNKAISMLAKADNISIENSNFKNSEVQEKLAVTKKITALVHFGRSGTGLLHSLIDGHPEVSTLPSIYFSEFFDHAAWEKIIVGGWSEMAERFMKIYEVLFDASSPTPIAAQGRKCISNLGQREGMVNVGEQRNEILSVNEQRFLEELNRLMACYDRLDAFTFFKLVHSAFDKALNDNNKKSLIFYHIHNPDTYAQLNFLKSAPNTNWLMMVREPVQSCESWVRISFRKNDYGGVAIKIFAMLFEVDNVIYRNETSIGVRLEDLKEYPQKTVSALCAWLGIKEEDSLYEMTAQGKKWWGDPVSPDFAKDGMNPFGKTSIKRELGSTFSKNDQFILRTLFYPFCVRFGYAEENTEQFKNDLQAIRPMLDQMFDFERKIVMETKADAEQFMKSGSYLYLRSGMIERWNTLNEFHTYPNMLKPLKIN